MDECMARMYLLVVEEAMGLWGICVQRRAGGGRACGGRRGLLVALHFLFFVSPDFFLQPLALLK